MTQPTDATLREHGSDQRRLEDQQTGRDDEPGERLDGATADADTSGESDDLSRFRLDCAYDEAEGERVIVRVDVRKPGRGEWIRCHPDQRMQLDTLLLEDPDSRRLYLVEPSLRPALVGELAPRRLVPTITRVGALYLWAARLPDRDGRIDAWSESALLAMRLARTTWVRLTANMPAGCYDVRRAVGQIPDPDWPTLSLAEMVEIAFAGRLIDSLDHPVLRRLRGE